MSSLTAEQRLQRVRAALLRDPKWQYLAGILMLGQHTVADDVLTAETDGCNVRYGREFITAISEPQLRGVVLHEAFHVMYRHLTVWYRLFKQDADRANDACDYVINIQIVDAQEQLPKGVLIDEKYRGWDAQRVFNDLSSANGKGRGGDKGAPLDVHDWDKAQERTAQEQSDLVREIDSALREGLVLAGRNKGNGYRQLQELLEPVVDWREVLREFVTSAAKGRDYATWRRPSRRHMAQDIYLPSMLSDKVDSVVIAIDTSGSISNSELQRFMSEVAGVCAVAEPSRVDLLYWGSSVVGHEVYEGEQCRDIATTTKPADGGGTNVACVFEFLKKSRIEASCIVVLTDGYTPWPAAVSTPVLWAITTKEVAPWGVTVPVREDV